MVYGVYVLKSQKREKSVSPKPNATRQKKLRDERKRTKNHDP